MTAPTSIRTQDKTGSSETMLHIRLSTALLLATSCVLRTAVSMEMVTTCEGNDVHHLSCDFGVIKVHTVLYGRADMMTCSEGRPQEQLYNTECSQAGATDAIKTRCDGKKVCEMNTKFVRNPDPCPGYNKYLHTEYSCVPANHVVACEHSTVHLSCDEGQVIAVNGADYGRHDQTTCSYNQPKYQVSRVDCNGNTNSTNIVATSCDGKNSCSVEVKNSVFGDPCRGTYKYLKVDYMCEYPY